LNNSCANILGIIDIEHDRILTGSQPLSASKGGQQGSLMEGNGSVQLASSLKNLFWAKKVLIAENLN
jgi:hypothetical protein